MSQTLRAVFDKEMDDIQKDLLEMAQMVKSAIDQSVNALQKHDLTLAAEVIANDVRINTLRFKIEQACITLIATQQPIAGDLRTLIAMLNMTIDLERMADHAAGIAKTVIKASDERPFKPLKKIMRMAQLSQEMLDECMVAFTTMNAEQACQVADRDKEMDQYYRLVFDRLVKVMSEKPRLVTRATYLMWCAHNLERIADRITNIAEQVLFAATGDRRELGT